MIVVDTNVLAYLYLPGEYTAAAEALLEGLEYDVDSLSLLSIVRDSDCSAYDCEFIALAMKLETKLMTMDTKLLRSFPEIAVPLTAG